MVDITGAKVPAVVEVWALARKGERSSALFGINRTPITGDISIWREKKEIAVYGCGLDRLIDVGGKSNLSVVVSVIAPFIPITTDGKEPDLSAFEETIAEAITKAARAALRNCGSDKPAEKRSHKYVVLDRLTEAISAVSGNGAHEFNLRQLFYHLRPFVNDEAGSELKYANFTQIITEYEAGNGEIEGMLRDARGVLYHPHLRQEIPLGTRAVKNYERPSWTFNKIIYLEKEGFFEVLKAARWPERNDCALLTSKGQATRAVKDLIDLLPDGGEPITVFCIHDADAAGTIIFEALQEETAARPRRRVEIVNLGLEPWEAVTMGLEIEEFDPSGRRPVAQYVKDRAEDTNWAEWLQTQRVELNAMTTPQFLAWLDDKLAPYDDGKVMPPDDVMAHRLRERVEQTIEAAIVAEVLAAANIDELVAQAITGIAWPDVDEVVEIVEAGFDTEPELRWSDWIDGTAKQLVEDR